MFAQEEISGGYTDKFFAENPSNAISWLDDLRKERYGATAESLLAESEKINNLEVTHVRQNATCGTRQSTNSLPPQLMLSIGKLSYLEQMSEDNEQVENGTLDGMYFLLKSYSF